MTVKAKLVKTSNLNLANTSTLTVTENGNPCRRHGYRKVAASTRTAPRRTDHRTRTRMLSAEGRVSGNLGAMSDILSVEVLKRYILVMKHKSRTYSPLTLDAARVLGQQVRTERIRKRWTIEDLAERVGVSRGTISNLENGDLSVALGTAFEAAALVGVPIFAEDQEALSRIRNKTELGLAVLPARVRRRDVNDDF